jgi:hypothetical protein
MRAALNCAAVSPSGGIGVPNRLVVSITMVPSRAPACSMASGTTLHGTETTTTSPNATDSAGVPARAGAPSSAAACCREARSRLNDSCTSCPAPTN